MVVMGRGGGESVRLLELVKLFVWVVSSSVPLLLLSDLEILAARSMFGWNDDLFEK